MTAHAEAESINDGEGEGERLGRVLRRSLSLNPSLVAAGEWQRARSSFLANIVPRPASCCRNADFSTSRSAVRFGFDLVRFAVSCAFARSNSAP